MVDIRKAFPRKYMSAVDVEDGRLIAQITAADMTTFRTGEQALMLNLHHNGTAPKLCRVNLTNRGILMAAFGPLTEGWIGKTIELSATSTSMGPGIGMSPVGDDNAAATSPHPAIPPKRPAAKPSQQKTSRIEDDRIPWLDGE